MKNEMSPQNVVDTVSQKVQNLIKTPTHTPMLLPKSSYQPFFLKVMSDFCMHHNIPQNLPSPSGNMLPHKLLSYIVDLMAYSMGKDKRDAIASELEEYKKGLPFDLR